MVRCCLCFITLFEPCFADMYAAFQVLVLMGKLGVSVGHSFIYLFFTELYPTVVRNTGLGVLTTAGRIGTIACPYILHIGKCLFVSFRFQNIMSHSTRKDLCFEYVSKLCSLAQRVDRRQLK